MLNYEFPCWRINQEKLLKPWDCFIARAALITRDTVFTVVPVLVCQFGGSVAVGLIFLLTYGDSILIY